MNSTALLAALRDSLATTYPARLGTRSTAPGAVTAIVAPSDWEFDAEGQCDPQPFAVTAQVVLVAAQSGETALWDLLTHEEAVCGLIRAAGWTVTAATAGDADEVPAIIYTTTAYGSA